MRIAYFINAPSFIEIKNIKNKTGLRFVYITHVCKPLSHANMPILYERIKDSKKLFVFFTINKDSIRGAFIENDIKMLQIVREEKIKNILN